MAINTTRNVYLETIYSMIEQGEDIVLVSADLGAPIIDEFCKDFPDRFVRVGIAEQNLIAVACGLAMVGKKVVAYAANPFPVLRAFDQIRNAVALMNLPISIVGVGAGVNIPEYGATHYCVEDVSLMRTCANFKIISVSDENVAKKVALYMTKSNGPLYIRFDRLVSGNLSPENEIDFKRGFRTFGTGKDIAVVTMGNFSQTIYKQMEELKSRGLSIKLIDIYCMPFDEQSFMEEIKNVEKIITLEEHVLQGGMGSAILDVLSDNGCHIPVKRLGLNFSSGYPEIYGTRDYILKMNGLDVESINKQIESFSQAK